MHVNFQVLNFKLNAANNLVQSNNPKKPELQFKKVQTQDCFVKFKGSDDDDDLFKTCPIDVDAIEAFGEKFLHGLRSQGIDGDVSPDVAQAEYRKYRKNIDPLMFSNDNNQVLKHEFVNVADWQYDRSINKKKRGEDINLLKALEEMVNNINEMTQNHQIFCSVDLYSEKITPKDILDIALKNLKGSLGERKVEVKNAGLLENIEGYCNSNPFTNYTIFSNLIGNAAKYSPAGSKITVDFEKRDIEHIDSDGKKSGKFSTKYYVIVDDEGIGIEPEDQERVLKKGERGSNAGEIGGTGFGLHAVYEESSRDVKITSPLYPDEPKYKGTRIEARIRKY